MQAISARIVCIGKDPGLLRSRCAVLAHAGYDARDLLYDQADHVLRYEQFDLAILSAILTDEEKQHIRLLVGGTIPVLALKKLVFASELLRDVERHLAHVRQST